MNLVNHEKSLFQVSIDVKYSNKMIIAIYFQSVDFFQKGITFGRFPFFVHLRLNYQFYGINFYFDFWKSSIKLEL